MNIKLKIGALIWSAVILTLGVALLGKVYCGTIVESDILALLPSIKAEKSIQKAVDALEKNIGRKVIFLIGSEVKNDAIGAAETFYRSLKDSPAFEKFNFKMRDDLEQSIFETFFPFRFSLLSREAREWLKRGDLNKIERKVSSALFSPASLASQTLIEKDPLFFFMDFMREIFNEENSLSLNNGFLSTEYKGKHYIFLSALIHGKNLSVETQEVFDRIYKNAKEIIASQYPEVEILSSGVIHHAIHGMKSMKKEIFVIGIISLIGIVLLIALTFVSLTPLILSLIPIAVGFLAASSVSLLVFDKIHLFTLVFGVSLIGISIDYSFHYFADQLNGGDSWSSMEGLKNIFPGITLGLLTSVIGFSALSIAPFPGLRQMALFSSTGIIAAYGSVIFWFPFLLKSKPSRYTSCLNILAGRIVLFWDEHISPKILVSGFIFMLIFIAFGVSKINFADDIRLLQSSPDELMEQEKEVRDIIRLNSANQFFIVRGKNAQEVLENEERLCEKLDDLISQGKLSGYRAISSMLPSLKTQKQNRRLLLKEFGNPDSRLKKFLETIGFGEEITRGYISGLLDAPERRLDFQDWNQSPLADYYGFLWLGKIGRIYFSMISLGHISDLKALSSIGDNIDNAEFIDHVEETSSLLGTYREIAGSLAMLAYVLILLLLMRRYGRLKGLLVILPPVLASLTAIGFVSLIGRSLNFFHVISLFLVLGIGIDYTLFFAERSQNRATTMLAVLLSGFTTILSFGLLALSNIEVIHSFGLIILVGITVVFITSPVVGAKVFGKI